jgi:two-component system OmpR family sensor kinase
MQQDASTANRYQGPARYRWVYPPGRSADSPPPNLGGDRFVDDAALALLTRYTTVRGFGQLLRRTAERLPAEPERVVAYSKLLEEQIDDFGHLIEEFVEAARLYWPGANLERRTAVLHQIAEVAVRRCSGMPEHTDRHRLVLDSPEPVSGQWDPSWLTPAITEVVSNALKFSPDGGTIALEIRRRGDHATITVHDPGLGIDASEGQHIFEPFVRGSAARGLRRCWGLGLFITSRVVVAHGGHIEIASAPGAGSSFTLWLPLTPEPVA